MGHTSTPTARVFQHAYSAAIHGALLKYGGCAGGRYDGLMKAVWQQAAVTSSPPPAAVGLTLNADRLTLLASAPKAKAPSLIPYLSQASPHACQHKCKS